MRCAPNFIRCFGGLVWAIAPSLIIDDDVLPSQRVAAFIGAGMDMGTTACAISLLQSPKLEPQERALIYDGTTSTMGPRLILGKTDSDCAVLPCPSCHVQPRFGGHVCCGGWESLFWPGRFCEEQRHARRTHVNRGTSLGSFALVGTPKNPKLSLGAQALGSQGGSTHRTSRTGMTQHGHAQGNFWNARS